MPSDRPGTAPWTRSAGAWSRTTGCSTSAGACTRRAFWAGSASLCRFCTTTGAPLAPTRAGHRVLRELGDHPALGDPEAVRVALGGRQAMTDQKLRADIFERPVTTLGPAAPRHSRHDIDHSDPKLAAFRARATGNSGAPTGLERSFYGSTGGT